MNYPSIRIEGAILSPDILDKLEDAQGQRPADFGCEPSARVKDEIVRAWADAQDYWRLFHHKFDSLKTDSPATTETRNLWVVPLMGLMGYQLEYQARGAEINSKNYPISHRVTNRGQTAFHIIGYREPSGLDRKSEKAALRMSAHALVQEYLNLSDQLYGLVTNGRILRLLRDSSRLVKLTYLEFDLDRIFNDGLFADFAVLFRLLHVSRLPATQETAAESLIEKYHQDSLESGERIREGLSRAVEEAISSFANGFLEHPANESLRNAIISGELKSEAYYQYLLRLIYRILFLLVIEERNLVYPLSPSVAKRDLYYRYYSLQRLRRLSEKRYLADRRKHDLWLALKACFHLFESGGPGQKLGLAPLAGDLFSADAVGPLNYCMLGNDILLGCLRSLGLYQNPDTRLIIRVNYSALNVEELGSVYEGLLKYKSYFEIESKSARFVLKPGADETQSHYTDDDLVQPLLKHSLDHLIAEKLKESEPEKALLSLRVADISCGSGHILLSAARRIATELAVVRTGEEQPSPTAFRTAVRDVIRECIYGVDLNPLAVELCKVALWLEAHNPGEPLNFLDHHIKCGNAIVGFVRREDLERGVPDEAFDTKERMTTEEKTLARQLRKRNKAERTVPRQKKFEFSLEVQKHVDGILQRWGELSRLKENTPEEIENKKRRYQDLIASKDAWFLNQIASIPIAQFYIPKEVESKFITDAEFRLYLSGERQPQGQATSTAWATAIQKKFFHWFMEFPEIIQREGFDCILGNPPYLGDKKLSGAYGYPFCRYVKWEYAPAGLSDLVVYFVRRIYRLLRPGGFTAFITTNSIKDGDIRKDSLEQILAQGGAINFAMRGTKWPGRANLIVSLVSIHKGEWHGKRVLDGKDVSFISPYFEDSKDVGEPKTLKENAETVSTGTYYLGDGFLLTHDEANKLIEADTRNQEVIYPIINGQEINNNPEQLPGRSIINFFDWTIEKAAKYEMPFRIIEERVKPEREKCNEQFGRDSWWLFMRSRIQAYQKIRALQRCFVSARTSKYLIISACPTHWLYSDAINLFTTDRWDIYGVIQSTIHEIWARKYSGALKQDLRYSPTNCFDTFPFPEEIWQTPNPALAEIGEKYHEHRRNLMRRLWLGLTDIYNLFHDRDLSPALVAKDSKKPIETAEAGHKGILELRRLHRELDETVRNAYGWTDLDLGHSFVEVETLPENDRVRYTISTEARKETLKRLLALNHERAALEMANTEQKTVKGKKTGKQKEEQEDPFALPPDSWARPMRDHRFEMGAMLTAILKTLGGPTPIRTVRLAAILALEPRLLVRYLDLVEAAAWRNNVGKESDPLPPGIAQLVPKAERAWGDRVRHLRGSGLLIENLEDSTWAPGPRLEEITTEGWADGRAKWVLNILKRQDIDSEHIIQELPDNLYGLWSYAEAV